MPGPVSLTLTSTRPSRATAASAIVAPRGQNLSALSIRFAIARSNSSTSTRHTAAAHSRRGGRPAVRPRVRRALGKAHADVVEQLADVDGYRAQLELGLVELGEVAERLHQARRVAGVAQRDLDQAAVVGALGVAGPAAVERLEAGDRRGQRRAQVVREVADAFAPEMIEPAQRAPLLAQRRQHHLERRGQLAELVAGRPRQQGLGRARGAFFETALRQRRDRIGQALQRPRHRGDHERREQGRQRDDHRDQRERRQREAPPGASQRANPRGWSRGQRVKGSRPPERHRRRRAAARPRRRRRHPCARGRRPSRTRSCRGPPWRCASPRAPARARP